MYLEHEMNLAEMQKLHQKIEMLDENLKITANEAKAKSEGEHTVNLFEHFKEVKLPFHFDKYDVKMC